jgi:N-acetylmuramic acid 6-phosphate etherase
MIPKDRSKIETELQNASSRNLHQKNIKECLDLISNEDQRVFTALQLAKPKIEAFLEKAVPLFERGGRVFYMGAGTSGRLGVLDASEIPPTFQIPPDRFIGIIAGGDGALRKSSEGKEDEKDGGKSALLEYKIRENDILIGIAAGGTTPYVLGAFEIAKKINPHILTAYIVCTDIPKPEAVDHLIYLSTGPEVVTGSTRMKAGTATKLALNMISTTIMIQTGRVYDNLMVDLRASNEKLVDRAIRIIINLTKLGREEAFALLQKAEFQTKPAIVMFFKKVDLKEALSLIEKNKGRLNFINNEKL